MSMNVGGGGRQTAEINVTPLIDVLLVLLIIFIIITPFEPTGQKALIPQLAAENQPIVPELINKTVVLKLTSSPDGRPLVRLNDTDVRWEHLRPQLQTIYAGRVERVIFVQADNSLEWDDVVQAIDVVHAAGVYNVGLMTDNLQRK